MCCYMYCLHRIKHVERANEVNAIETLMVTDELFRFGGKAPYKVNHDLIGIIIFADQLIFPHDRGMWLL